MRIKITVLLIFVSAFSFISLCKSNVSNEKIDSKCDTIPDQDTSELESKTLMVYYEKSEKYYDYFIKELPGDNFILLAEFETLPADVIWDTVARQVYFVTQNGVLMKNYLKKNEKFQKLSDPLPKEVFGLFNTAWIDNETGEICISYGISVDQTNLAKYQKLEKLADYLPEWGGEVIFGILKLNKSGNWETVVEKASKCCAGMTPGITVLNDYIKINDKYVSTSTIINNSMSFYGVPSNSELLMDADFEKYFKGVEVPSADAFFLARLSNCTSLISSAAWGDAPHNILPCYFWNNNNSELQEIVLKMDSDKANYNQLGFQITKDYLLIASEYQHESPKIFDIQTLRLVYENPEASHAFILKNE